jgi:hypothetical protein
VAEFITFLAFQMGAEPNDYLAVLKAVYDYEPQSDDEIALTEDQVVFLLERCYDDWWRVKIKGDSHRDESPVGLVPGPYLEQVKRISVVKALYDYDAISPGELSIKEDEILNVYGTEDEWLLVQSQKVGGKAGFVPGSCVEVSSSISPNHSYTTEIPQKSTPNFTSAPEFHADLIGPDPHAVASSAAALIVPQNPDLRAQVPTEDGGARG